MTDQLPPAPPPLPAPPAPPAWLAIALRELDVQEVLGAGDNPRIIEYLKSTTLKTVPKLLHDETAWCSSFVNWCVTQAGLVGTNLANARSWLTWGQPLQVPRVGCIAVFSRPDAGPASGHVAFYERESSSDIYVFGGNQHNRVCLAPYPRARLISYRWPRTQ